MIDARYYLTREYLRNGFEIRIRAARADSVMTRLASCAVANARRTNTGKNVS